MIYRPSGRASGDLVVLSHGYGGKHTAYSFIAQHLASRGHPVVAIQHELPGDLEMPTQGEPRIVRKPFWRAGVQNVQFTLAELRGRLGIPARGPVILIGHSNGGDVSMLYATEHPDAVRAVVTLDHRRMPVPQTSTPRICSARSSDQVPDAGVLPDVSTQQALGMIIETIPELRHNDMWDIASTAHKAAMRSVIDRCLAGMPPTGR